MVHMLGGDESEQISKYGEQVCAVRRGEQGAHRVRHVKLETAVAHGSASYMVNAELHGLCRATRSMHETEGAKNSVANASESLDKRAINTKRWIACTIMGQVPSCLGSVRFAAKMRSVRARMN